MLNTYRIAGRAAIAALLLSALGACQDNSMPTAPLAVHPNPIIIVTPEVNSVADPGDGTCDVTQCTLREAIAAASSGATITFASGITDPIVLASGELVLTKNVTIAGPSGGTVTISGNNASRVFFVSSGVTAELRNLTVTAGNASGGYMNYPFDTEPGHGGGILNDGGALTIRNCTISGNQTQSTRAGGGIFNAVGTLVVENSTISGNSAGFYGGGIYNYGNDGQQSLTVTNSTISGNQARDWGRGGGIYNKNGLAHILYTTITSNLDEGLTTWDMDPTTTVRTDLEVSIVSGNTGGDIVLTYGDYNMPYVSLGHNLIGVLGYGNFTGVFSGTDQTGVTTPGLGALASNGGPTRTHALVAGSPAINTGPTSGCPATDQRGTTRPQGSACDIGAYELVSAGGTTPTFTFDLSTLPAKTFGDGTFSVASYVSTNSSGAVTFATHSGSAGCSVSSSGTVTISGAAVDPSACTIDASLAADATYTSAGPISQSFNIAKAAGSVSISNLPASGTIGGSFTPTYTKSGDGTPSTASNSTSICTVTSGVVDFIAAGTCLLQASVTEGTNYLAATGTEQTFDIALVTPTFSFDLSTLPAPTFGDGTFSVASYATTNSSGAITFDLGSGSVGCSVTTGGTVTISGAAVDPAHCVIAATLAASGDYAGAGPIDQSFNIAKAAGSVSINNMPTSPTVGSDFTPTYTKAGDGTASVTSLTTGICTVSGGVVSFIAEGSCILQASVTAGTSHLAAIGTEQPVTVLPAPVFSSTCKYTINPKNDQRQVNIGWANAVPGVTQIQVTDGRIVTKQIAPSASGTWSTNVKTGVPAYGLWGGTTRKDISTVLVAAGTACSQIQ